MIERAILTKLRFLAFQKALQQQNMTHQNPEVREVSLRLTQDICATENLLTVIHVN